MHEQLVRQAEARQQAQNQGQGVHGAVPPGSVDEALAQAMATGKSNSLVAVIERFNKDTQQKEKAFFVVRAGRGGKLNEAAAKKGGIALMRSVCVRASWEKPEQIQRLYEGLPSPELRTKLLESRGFDFRAFTAPEGWSIYLYTILFGSGEKWQGEGIANPGNIKADNRHWQDSTAETRAFSRTVGRGTGEGLLPGDQLAGSGEIDEFDPESGEAELLSEAEVAVRVAATQRVASGAVEDMPAAQVKAAMNALKEEAGPEAGEPFRSPDDGGQSGTGTDPVDAGGAESGSPAPGGSEAAGVGEPISAGSWLGHPQTRGDRGADAAGSQHEYSISQLIPIATLKGVLLKDLAGENCGTHDLKQLSSFQRGVLYQKLQELPDKQMSAR